MDYTDAILRRLRDRLLRYRSESRIGGRKRTWQTIARDIVDADTVPQAFYDKEDNFAVLGEALRRFAAGLQTPTVERLDAITAFLLEKHCLGQDELDDVDSPIQVLSGLAQFFGRDGAQSGGEQTAFCGRFVAARHWEGGRNEYKMLTITAAGNAGLRTEEATHLTNARTHSTGRAELERFFKVASTATIKHDGWVVEVGKKQVLILVRDRLTGKAGLQSLIHADRDSADKASSLHILHHGGFVHPDDLVHFRSSNDETHTTHDLVTSWISMNVWQFDREKGD